MGARANSEQRQIKYISPAGLENLPARMYLGVYDSKFMCLIEVNRKKQTGAEVECIDSGLRGPWFDLDQLANCPSAPLRYLIQPPGDN